MPHPASQFHAAGLAAGVFKHTAWRQGVAALPRSYVCFSQDDSPEGNPTPTLPADIVSVSAHTAEGLVALQDAIGSLFPKSHQYQDGQEALLAQIQQVKDDNWA